MEYSEEQVRENNGKGGKPLFIVIDGKVYDVTGFDHPGGVDLLEPKEDQLDRGDDFADVGHSYTAQSLLNQMYVGDLKKEW